MAATIDDAWNGIDELAARHAIVNKDLQLIDIIPTINIVALETSNTKHNIHQVNKV